MNASIITVHLIDFVFAKFLLTLTYVDHRWILKDKAGDVLYCHCQQIPRPKPTMLLSNTVICGLWPSQAHWLQRKMKFLKKGLQIYTFLKKKQQKTNYSLLGTILSHGLIHIWHTYSVRMTYVGSSQTSVPMFIIMK